MKKRFYGVFNSINDAKEALGRIKKESLNLVDLTVVYLENDDKLKNNASGFEMAAENFIGGQTAPNHSRYLTWPGLKDYEIEGFGKLMVGKSNLQSVTQNADFVKEQIQAMEPEIINKKVVAIIEAEPEVAGKVRYILESIGADVVEE